MKEPTPKSSAFDFHFEIDTSPLKWWHVAVFCAVVLAYRFGPAAYHWLQTF